MQQHHDSILYLYFMLLLCFLGSFVADTATMPLHWIYDTDKIASLLKEAGKDEEPEFFNPPSCPFYSYALGELSPYGDETRPLLSYVARTGAFDPEGFAKESYEYLKSYKGRLNHVSKVFMAAVSEGKKISEAAVDDSQAHGIIKVS